MWFFLKQLAKKFWSNKLVLFLLTICVILIFIIGEQILYSKSYIDPSRLIGLMLILLLILASCGLLIGKKTIASAFYSKNQTSSRHGLQKKIVNAFVISAIVPTIIITIFSIYFFNMGLQAWFDKKISKVLEQSVIVAESYINEHKIQMRSTSISIANQLAALYRDIIHDPKYFNKILNSEVDLRRLSEAIVFHGKSKDVLAQSSLSFSLSFSTISDIDIQKASRGHIVEIKSDPRKIRMLIKIDKFNDTYLIIGRLVDKKTVEHIDKTNGTAYEYFRLKKNIKNMETKFFLIFILIVALLLLFSIGWGVFFTRQIIEPLQRLVDATNKVKKGDLSVRIDEQGLGKDEIRVLTRGFNLMIKQLARQQYDLVIAQRALVWSDVARRVAHEIKNPLTPIMLSIEHLSTKFGAQVKDKKQFTKYLDMIRKHTDIIKDIVVEFVRFARLPTPKFETRDIVSLIRSIISSRSLQKNGIKYDFISKFEKLDFICDTTQMNQVMVNLLKNSEEAIKKHAETSKQDFYGIIEVKLETDQDKVIIKLCDNGPGFSKELLKNATEAYISDSKGGMGLGLAIVKKIVQDHLGVIEIRNKAEGGAQLELIFEQTSLKN